MRVVKQVHILGTYNNETTTLEKKNKVKDLESKLQRAVDTMDFEEADYSLSL